MSADAAASAGSLAGIAGTERGWSQYPKNLQEPDKAQIPIGRFVAVDEIAAACLYPASDRAAGVTGQAIHVNGGQHMF